MSALAEACTLSTSFNPIAGKDAAVLPPTSRPRLFRSDWIACQINPQRQPLPKRFHRYES